MRYFLVFLLFCANSHSNEALSKFYSKKLSLSDEQLLKVSRLDVISDSKISSNSKNKTQSMEVFVTGIHPKKCSRALRKISMYEKYRDFIDFTTYSAYDDANEKIHLIFDHTLLPNKMILKFKIPRIKKPGDYPFYFDWGMFIGLKGIINVREYKKQCWFLLSAKWNGKDTGYPDLIMEAFTQTLMRIALEKLIRISLI